MGLLDQPLTLKLVIKIGLTFSSVVSIRKCFWAAFFYAYDCKKYKKSVVYSIVILINIAFVYWLWS